MYHAISCVSIELNVRCYKFHNFFLFNKKKNRLTQIDKLHNNKKGGEVNVSNVEKKLNVSQNQHKYDFELSGFLSADSMLGECIYMLVEYFSKLLKYTKVINTLKLDKI